MRKLKILLSAYCCEPNRGSEPGVGWNIARGLARHHEVWVLTRASNRQAIEAALPSESASALHFVYYDLPRWACWWKHGMRGLQLYYYLWQIGIAREARSLHRRIGFDIAHHLTLGKYWAPTFLWTLHAPLIWGPVGGGDTAPVAYYRSYSIRGKLYEVLRSTARTLAFYDPFLNLTARRARTAIVATPEAERGLIRLGARSIRRMSGQTGVSMPELATLDCLDRSTESPFRILTVGRLLHWKGVHLGLSAFAQANLSDAVYWIVGDGPEQERLKKLAAKLKIQEKVTFCGQLPRDKALTLLRRCDVLLHPSVHDFSPTVVFEAMAARKPVLCLRLGGLAVQVTPETGIAVPAGNPEQAVARLAQSMRLLRSDADLRWRLGDAGRERVKARFTWDRKVRMLLRIYAEAVTETAPAGRGSDRTRRRAARVPQ